MIDVVQNIDLESDIAFFVQFNGYDNPSAAEFPNADKIMKARGVIERYGNFPDVDLICTAALQGVVLQKNKSRLKAHLEALDPPLDDVLDVLFAAEKEGEIGREDWKAVYPITEFNWHIGENAVYDAQGRVCELDDDGNPRPDVFNAPADLDALGDEIAHKMCKEHDLNAYIWQVEIEWTDSSPRINELRNHQTMGRLLTSGKFEPVLTVIDLQE